MTKEYLIIYDNFDKQGATVIHCEDEHILKIRLASLQICYYKLSNIRVFEVTEKKVSYDIKVS